MDYPYSHVVTVFPRIIYLPRHPVTASLSSEPLVSECMAAMSAYSSSSTSELLTSVSLACMCVYTPRAPHRAPRGSGRGRRLHRSRLFAPRARPGTRTHAPRPLARLPHSSWEGARAGRRAGLQVGEGPAAQAAGPACERVLTLTAPRSAGAPTEWADAEDRRPRQETSHGQLSEVAPHL